MSGFGSDMGAKKRAQVLSGAVIVGGVSPSTRANDQVFDAHSKVTSVVVLDVAGSSLIAHPIESAGQRPVPILGPAFCVPRTTTAAHEWSSSPWSSSWSSQSLSRLSASLVTLSGTWV